MSSSERHRLSKRVRSLCAACRAGKAKFKYRGEVRADRDHTLCFECYRREINRARANQLVAPTVGWRVLDDWYMAHRQRMLDHLQRSFAATATSAPCASMLPSVHPDRHIAAAH